MVDDNPTVRHYLRALLEQQKDWLVCADARTGQEALLRVQESIPDVVLLDFQLPDVNGLEVARELVHDFPEIPILMVTVYLSTELASSARAAGIRGICAKSDIGSIVQAVQTLLHSETYFPNQFAENIIGI